MHGQFDAGQDKTLGLRFGRQVLEWGGTVLHMGGTFDAYDRFGVVSGSLGVDKVFPKTLGADRVVMLVELGFSHVNGLPDTSLRRYGRPLAYNGAACAGVPAYANAVPGIGLTPSLTVSKDIKGYSYDGAYSKGRTLIRPQRRLK